MEPRRPHEAGNQKFPDQIFLLRLFGFNGGAAKTLGFETVSTFDSTQTLRFRLHLD